LSMASTSSELGASATLRLVTTSPLGHSGDILRIIREAATTHSPRASDADDDVRAGHLRGRLRTIRACIGSVQGISSTSSV
jgi:hypothetical protein